MGRNIDYQFFNAINSSFREGGKDKHSIKAECKKKEIKRPKGIIYSYSDYGNLIETGKMICNYMKENNIKFKFVKDITSEVLQQLLLKKAQKVSKETIKQYTFRMGKLGLVVNKAYGCAVNWEKELYIPAVGLPGKKLRDTLMCQEDYNKLELTMQGCRSRAVIAIKLARKLALRVSEICKIQVRDINLETGIIHIHESKGKRSRDLTVAFEQCLARDIHISDEDRLFLLEITKGLKPTDRICNLKSDSINKFLARMEVKAGIREKYKNAATGIHSIRKLRAQELYDSYRNMGYDKKKAWDMVSKYLGHGLNRGDLFDVYITNKY